MALKGQADLYNAPAEDNESYGTNQAEDKVAQIVDDRDRVTLCRKGIYTEAKHHRQGDDQHAVEAESLPHSPSD